VSCARLQLNLLPPLERKYGRAGCCEGDPAEIAAIGYELAAGRFTVAPRGRSGLPERVDLGAVESARIAFWIALHRVRTAA
jgi:hypothetical protein